MIQTYAMVLYPGIIVSDTSEKQVSSRDPNKFKMPKHAFGFRFFDKEILEGVTGKTYGTPHNFSGWHYKGTVRTIEQVKEQEPDSILYRNMKGNGYNRIVDTEAGQCIPMEDDDMIVVDKQ